MTSRPTPRSGPEATTELARALAGVGELLSYLKADLGLVDLARPGTGVQVSLSGTHRLEETVERAGRRIAIAAGGGMLVLAAAAWLAGGDRSLRPWSTDAVPARADTQPPTSARRARRARTLLRRARAC